jgi:hypothetical protein
MRDVLLKFQDKKREIEIYFVFLEIMQKENVEINGVRFQADKEIKTILKANSFLLLYNIVESSIKGAIRAIYDSIRADGLTYQQVTDEIKRLWVRYKYSDIGKNNAGHGNYVERARKIVNEIVSSTILDMTGYKLRLSGNIDAENIRGLAKQYGFSFNVRAEAHGGTKLQTVRERRNHLAHGDMSFDECGRDFAFSELSQIKEEALFYLEDILHNIEEYINDRQYSQIVSP